MPLLHVETSPPLSADRPTCPECGLLMRLSRIEPTEQAGHDLRVFECQVCDNTESIVVKFR